MDTEIGYNKSCPMCAVLLDRIKSLEEGQASSVAKEMEDRIKALKEAKEQRMQSGHTPSSIARASGYYGRKER